VNARFTIDGSEALEKRLAGICVEVCDCVEAVVSSLKLEALVLGGGYGRGEGGVLVTDAGDQPYNDLEFYVFMRGHRLLSERKYHQKLHELAEDLASHARLHIEFKIDSIDRLESSPVSMFSYDLVAGHRIILGDEHVFEGSRHHLSADKIPLAEATRLLFNRGTGLLLAQDFLRNSSVSAEQSDFVARNLAKAQLALGDVVLTALKKYHWSCRERHRRLMYWQPSEPWPLLDKVREYHALGVEFKLHPLRVLKSASRLQEEHAEISRLTLALWLWLENRRLKCEFSSARDYALNTRDKCPDTPKWQNYILNVKSFGFKAVVDSMAWRYPRERLLNSLALLLWGGEVSKEPEIRRLLQKQLATEATDWTGLVAAYKQVWSGYG